MKKTLLTLGIVIVLVAGVFLVARHEAVLRADQYSNIRLSDNHLLHTPSGQVLHVRIAIGDREGELGLSHFSSLPANEGMLFPFDSDAPPFWMKDMNFPLDIVWLKKISATSFQVVSVSGNALPSSYPAIFKATGSSDTVLEIDALESGTLGLVPGAVINLTSN